MHATKIPPIPDTQFPKFPLKHGGTCFKSMFSINNSQCLSFLYFVCHISVTKKCTIIRHTATSTRWYWKGEQCFYYSILLFMTLLCLARFYYCYFIYLIQNVFHFLSSFPALWCRLWTACIFIRYYRWKRIQKVWKIFLVLFVKFAILPNFQFYYTLFQKYQACSC